MKKWAALALVTLFIGGCSAESSEHEEHMEHGEEVAILEVEILNDLEAEPGDTLTLSAQVTQNGEAVDDAEEVLFEVWESGHFEESTKVEGTLTADGVYEGSYTFAEEGVYYMFAHTTARDYHVMPKEMITIGNPDPEDVLDDNSTHSMDHK